MAQGDPINGVNATSGTGTYTIQPAGAATWSVQSVFASAPASVYLTDGSHPVKIATLGQPPLNQLNNPFSPMAALTWSITYPGVYSSGQLTPTALPASDPTVSGAMLVSHTYSAASDAPAVTNPSNGQALNSWAKVFRFDVSGPVSTTTGTLGWRMVKNGTQVATGTSASQTGSDYWSAAFFFTSLIDGDALGVQVWRGTATSAQWDWYGYICEMTQVLVSPGTYWYNLGFKVHYIQDVIALYASPPTRGFLNTPTHSLNLLQPFNNTLTNIANAVQDTVYQASFLESPTAQQTFRIQYGDVASSNTVLFATVNATNTAFGGANDLITQITGQASSVTGIPFPVGLKITNSVYLTVVDTSGSTNNMGFTGTQG